MLDWNQAEGRPSWITGLGMAFYYPIVLLAIGGIVVLRRRQVRQWPLLMLPLIITIGTVLSYGQTRFRVTAEPSLVVLAAVAIAALAARWWPERAAEPTSPADDDPEPTLVSA
jgi:asparagine N-glycosylation enzyme membrane subunit Stt3